MTTKQRRPSSVEKKLIGLADIVISAAERSKDPTFAIPIRALSNVSFNERKGLIEMGHKKQTRSFSTSAWRKNLCRPCWWLTHFLNCSARISPRP